MPQWLIWVIVVIVVLVVLAIIVSAANRAKKTRNRQRAGQMREEATERASEVQQREARARETEAQAAAARAEADRKQAEAERLEAQAGDRGRSAAELREEHEEHLRRADEIDPDVDTSDDRDRGPATDPSATGSGGTVPAAGTGDPAGPTVTHPDGRTEQVEPPEEGAGGSHRL